MRVFLQGKRERINSQKDSQQEMKEVTGFISLYMAVFYCSDRINEKAQKIDATEITPCYQHICRSTRCITRGEPEKSSSDHCSERYIWVPGSPREMSQCS